MTRKRKKRREQTPSTRAVNTAASNLMGPHRQDPSIPEHNAVAAIEARRRRPSVAVIAAVVGVIVAVVGVAVPLWLYNKAQARETANVRHYLLIQPLDLQKDGSASRWEAILGTMNMGPAAVKHGNTYMALSPTKAQLAAVPQVMNRPPIARVEVNSAGAPREVSFAFENLPPTTGFAVRLEFFVPERLRAEIKFTLGNPRFVAHFIQFVSTSGEKIQVDYTSISAQPIPTLKGLVGG